MLKAEEGRWKCSVGSNSNNCRIRPLNSTLQASNNSSQKFYVNKRHVRKWIFKMISLWQCVKDCLDKYWNWNQESRLRNLFQNLSPVLKMWTKLPASKSPARTCLTPGQKPKWDFSGTDHRQLKNFTWQSSWEDCPPCSGTQPVRYSQELSQELSQGLSLPPPPLADHALTHTCIPSLQWGASFLRFFVEAFPSYLCKDFLIMGKRGASKTLFSTRSTAQYVSLPRSFSLAPGPLGHKTAVARCLSTGALPWRNTEMGVGWVSGCFLL